MENYLYSLYQKVKLIVNGTILEVANLNRERTQRIEKYLRIRYGKSKWLRFLVDSFGLIGDRGYRGCEYVEVCESKEQKGTSQVVEGVNSQIKVFNQVSRWRKGITLLVYICTSILIYTNILIC